MAIWTIPNEYKIDYSPNGDDVKSFSQKVKYCLEESFNSLRELRDAAVTLNSAVQYLSAATVPSLPIQLANPQDGQILVYHAATQTFQNEEQTPVGESKSLIIRDGETILCDYNGSTTSEIDLQSLTHEEPKTATQEIEHLTRLVENLYLALDVMELDPGGYDAMSSTTFYSTANDVDESRSSGTISNGKVSGDGAVLITNPISFINVATGVETLISKAHLVVKHQNVADAEITAEIAMFDATFAHDEVIAIGTGAEQTVSLAHTENLSTFKFALYFNGVEQTGNFSFFETSGQVTFVAPAGAIVSADYFYNWGAENFVAMEKTGTFPDRRNRNRATTQFTYDGVAGRLATLRITLNQKSGEAQNEIVATGAGKAKGYKLAHQAIEDEIHVTPEDTTWQYNAAQNTIIVTAPIGQGFSVSYWWKGKSFSVDSFACVFNE